LGASLTQKNDDVVGTITGGEREGHVGGEIGVWWTRGEDR